MTHARATVRGPARRRPGAQVGINSYPLATAPLECPWSGAKGSGFGYHSGADGWRQFSVPKSLVFTVPLPAELSEVTEAV